MTNPAKLLFLGLPESGKTTYLAALWHVLTDGNASSLRLTRMSGNRTYLNQIAKEWRECSQVPRTNLQTDEVIVLNITHDGLREFELSIPDLAGEAFKQQLLDRRISLEHDNFVREATGVILFIHPDVRKPTQLSLANRLQASLPQFQANAPSTESPQNAWSADLVPHCVQFVDLLQFLLERSQKKLRLVVVVSAWDLVDDLGMAPNVYVENQVPLLHQFLVANDDLIEHEVFGVSAQGGDIKAADQKKSLLSVEDASLRIKVVHGDEKGHDIAKPIVWLLERG